MKTLLKTKVIITPEKEKTNIFLPFTVEKKAKKLIINYRYAPKFQLNEEITNTMITENIIRDAGEIYREYSDFKRYKPLKNLITLSLDSPDGYVGAAHRQKANQHHEISESFASYGFDRTKIVPGEWVLSLNVHAVVTDSCICRIEVSADE